MRRGQIGSGLLVACLILGTGCQAREAEPDVMEITSRAPAVKLEYAEQPDEAVVINNGTLLLQISDLAIAPAPNEVFDEAWIYRFTYNPPEAVLSGQVVEVLFGPEHMSVNGVVYLPWEGPLTAVFWSGRSSNTNITASRMRREQRAQHRRAPLLKIDLSGRPSEVHTPASPDRRLSCFVQNRPCTMSRHVVSC